jgi:hypothetical protein
MPTKRIVFFANNVLFRPTSSNYFEVYGKHAHSRAGGAFSLNLRFAAGSYQNDSATVSNYAALAIATDNAAGLDSVFLRSPIVKHKLFTRCIELFFFIIEQFLPIVRTGT